MTTPNNYFRTEKGYNKSDLSLYLKSKDIEYSEGGVLVAFRAADDVVDSLHQPGKQSAVQGLGYSIPVTEREGRGG